MQVVISIEKCKTFAIKKSLVWVSFKTKTTATTKYGLRMVHLPGSNPGLQRCDENNFAKHIDRFFQFVCEMKSILLSTTGPSEADTTKFFKLPFEILP
jgi:hypothetical protein